MDREAPQDFLHHPLDWLSHVHRPLIRLDHPLRAEFGGPRRRRSPHSHRPVHLLHRRQRWMKSRRRQTRTFGLQMRSSGPLAE